jgi:hypothetical protein
MQRKVNNHLEDSGVDRWILLLEFKETDNEGIPVNARN